MEAPPTSRSSNSNSPSSARTCRAAAMISGPMPSPGRRTMRFMRGDGTGRGRGRTQRLLVPLVVERMVAGVVLGALAPVSLAIAAAGDGLRLEPFDFGFAFITFGAVA